MTQGRYVIELKGGSEDRPARVITVDVLHGCDVKPDVHGLVITSLRGFVVYPWHRVDRVEYVGPPA